MGPSDERTSSILHLPPTKQSFCSPPAPSLSEIMKTHQITAKKYSKPRNFTLWLFPPQGGAIMKVLCGVAEIEALWDWKYSKKNKELMAQVWRLSSHYHFLLRVQKEMWNKVTEAKPKGTFILVKQLLLPFSLCNFSWKCGFYSRAEGEATSQFHLPPLIRVSWVTVRIKTKEKKLQLTPRKNNIQQPKGLKYHDHSWSRINENSRQPEKCSSEETQWHIKYCSAWQK